MPSLFVEQLTVIDCAVLDAQRGLVGQSWIVDVELDGELDDQSMVLDFGDVKRRIKRAIDTSVDHTLLVPSAAPQLSLHRGEQRVELSFASDAGRIEQHAPRCAVSLFEAERVTAEQVAATLERHLKSVVPPSVAGIHVSLREERIDGAFYHYAHGLKKHDGACQRIAHGHRSRLEIRIDGERDRDREAATAQRWSDIYLATRGDRIDAAQGRLRFAYDAREGRYELELPEARCELVDGDTTVETLASVLLDRQADVPAHCAIEVRAYEGVMKGAVARRAGSARTD